MRASDFIINTEANVVDNGGDRDVERRRVYESVAVTLAHPDLHVRHSHPHGGGIAVFGAGARCV